MQSKIVANGMIRINTPVEDYRSQYGLWVKREDLACPKPGPPFSKARGVYARISNRPEKLIGVLDTYHSQGGHAVARACQILGKICIVYYPEFKHEPGWRDPQEQASKLGANLKGLPAGRSAILFHQARKDCERLGGYMMPNALKLSESVDETAKEISSERTYNYVLISASSGTIAAGVIKGFYQHHLLVKKFLIHLGYSRSHDQVLIYLKEASGVANATIEIVDENYGYKDKAKAGLIPPWPCNEYYDLKAFRWWLSHRKQYSGSTLFWNIG